MQWSDHYRRYARYNAWINQSLLQASLQLPVHQQNQDKQLYFSSLVGTWNHILVGDLLWLGRLRHTFPILDDALSQWAQPEKLDQILYPELSELAHQRQILDELIIQWCDLLREADSQAVLVYNNIKGEEVAKPLPQVLQHLFNHQTHHRGQISAVLSQLGVDYGPTDFLFMPEDD